LVQRGTELFTYLLEYVFEVLSIEQSEDLPAHLKPEVAPDDYVTMLYNDEVHSYEQVVSTLRKVLIIDEKKAYEYAAIVDKEGRSTIKRGKRADCAQIKSKVETTMGGPLNNSLETKLLHHSLVAHQYFAEKILVWLQKISEVSKGLKHILCKIGLFTTNPPTTESSHSIIEKIMLSDSIFWKSVRAVTHQYFIGIYFMDPYWKREFAVVYTKNYKLIWRNHVNNPDDTISLTDLAVQMFTVISLSKYLLREYNLLQIIMETLIEHSKTSKGKLSFPRSRQRNNPEFKRAQYMLFDLKYCLTSTPQAWDDRLRASFINGFKSFIEFLKFMHGMDALKRQTQAHIEFEPEWETSFNLLIKLQKSISSLIDWCSSDKVVYLQCYKYLLNAINQIETSDALFTYAYDKCKFEGHSYEIIDYSVLRSDVSIHAPLTRLFASIYPHLNKFELNFGTVMSHLQQQSAPSLSSRSMTCLNRK
jgi:E3 ubiquitin-protein ligase UBR2